MKSFAEFLRNKDKSSQSRFGKLSEADQPQQGQAQPQAPAAQPQQVQAQPQAPAAQPQQGQAQQQAPGASETAQLLKYLEDNKAGIKHYKKFAKVKARQSGGGEQVQTKLSGRDESEVRTTKPGDWVVSNIESQGEQQIVDDATFKKRYDVSNPKGDIFSPKNAHFHGVLYTGPDISFAPPNWGGSKMHITTGYMIGGPEPDNFAKDFYGIDPKAFASTYKPADQVSESWMRGVFGVSPSKKNYDGINEAFTGAVQMDAASLFDGLEEDSKQAVLHILSAHPELIEGIRKFKESEPEKFRDSIGNFNTNSVSEDHLRKLASGRSLGYYDWM